MSHRKGGKSPPLTPSLAARIKRLWADTDLTQHAIGAMLGVNQGRVSEVVSGLRYPNVQPEPRP